MKLYWVKTSEAWPNDSWLETSWTCFDEHKPDRETDIRCQGPWQKLGGNRGKIYLAAKKGAEASALVRSTRSKRRAADIRPIVADIQAAGATSLRQIAAALNERHIKTSRGKDWTPTQVMRVMGRAVR